MKITANSIAFTTQAAFCVAMALLALAPFSYGVSVVIANSSFELPALTDNGIQNSPTVGDQGGSGWIFSTGSNIGGIYNPTSGYYANADGNGTPAGANGAQISYVFRLNASASQTLSGSDAILGNADDPVLTSLTIYTLTLAVGQRLLNNPAGNFPFGTLSLALLAGSTVIAEDNNVGAPGLGQFADRSISVNSATLNPVLYGQPLSIRIMQLAGTDSVADLDNVRLDAIVIPEPSSALMIGIGLLAFGVLRHRPRVLRYLVSGKIKG